MVQHHSDTTTRLDDMITREEWDSAVAYMNEEKGQVDLRREDGTIVFEKAARAGAPLRFFKQGLRQIGEHKSKVRLSLCLVNPPAVAVLLGPILPAPSPVINLSPLTDGIFLLLQNSRKNRQSGPRLAG